MHGIKFQRNIFTKYRLSALITKQFTMIEFCMNTNQVLYIVIIQVFVSRNSCFIVPNLFQSETFLLGTLHKERTITFSQCTGISVSKTTIT